MSYFGIYLEPAISLDERRKRSGSPESAQTASVGENSKRKKGTRKSREAIAILASIANEAQANGLTEEKMRELLASDD